MHPRDGDDGDSNRDNRSSSWSDDRTTTAWSPQHLRRTRLHTYGYGAQQRAADWDALIAVAHEPAAYETSELSACWLDAKLVDDATDHSSAFRSVAYMSSEADVPLGHEAHPVTQQPPPYRGRAQPVERDAGWSGPQHARRMPASMPVARARIATPEEALPAPERYSQTRMRSVWSQRFEPLALAPEVPRRRTTWLYTAAGAVGLLVGVPMGPALLELIAKHSDLHGVRPSDLMQPQSAAPTVPDLLQPATQGARPATMRAPAAAQLQAASDVPINPRRHSARYAAARATTVEQRDTGRRGQGSGASSSPPDMNFSDQPGSPSAPGSPEDTSALRKLTLIDEPRAPVAPQAARGEIATLRINSRPWSRVFLDDRLVGNTPQHALTVVPGEHRVRLENAEFQMTKTLHLTLAPGEIVTRVETLEE